jgi:uncharacterized protein (DUF1501 family)
MARNLLNTAELSLPRRRFLQAAAMSAAGVSASGWLPAFAESITGSTTRKRQCILLWMAGGPSQTDTFDMKPGHANGGEFKESATKVPGLRFSEHLPKLAEQADKLAIVRGLNTKEGDHGRGTYLVRTGQTPGGALRYPAIGSALSKELGDANAELPNYLSILPFSAINPAAFSPGYLGPRYAAATVGETESYNPNPTANRAVLVSASGFAELGVDHLRLPPGIDLDRANRRLAIWRRMQDRFVASHHAAAAVAQNTVYERAVRMMQSSAIEAFDLSQEPAEVREAYGRGRFGQGCLMARRLIEHGVPFVEVTLGDFTSQSEHWDTHQDNFRQVRNLSNQLDAGWGTLMKELAERGLLETTTVLWIGEFGRTPKINETGGRDHYPQAWTCVLGGGGIKGGQAYGKTSEDGTEVTDGKTSVANVLATLCAALGVDPADENMTEMGRPVKIVEGEPMEELLAS